MLGELLDDVLPEVVEDAADADPGVLAGAADERVDAEAQRADLRLGGELGDRLELALGLGVVELVVVGSASVSRHSASRLTMSIVAASSSTAQRSGFSAAMS